MELTASDQDWLAGAMGPAGAVGMRLLAALGRATGARRLIDVSAAHIDGALYIGQSSLDYAARLRDSGGRVSVPTTLNVSSLDLLHPELYRGPDAIRNKARATMQAYEDMGCLPTWTCAPYQLATRPSFGQRVAWAESNAVVFANSVLGARTERLGDFVDIAAAIVGRIPETGLYLDENRRATVRYDVAAVPDEVRRTDEFFAVLGVLIGRDAGRRVPVITGIETAGEDQLKALGAAAATTGTVGMFHVAGLTPEAPTLADATGGRKVFTVVVGLDMLEEARRTLTSTAAAAPLRTVNLGTPHYSSNQIAQLSRFLAGRRVHESVRLYVNTGRDVLRSIVDAEELEALGVRFVTDTCTYLTPIIEERDGVAMTDSAKWAYYAPNNLGFDVVFASTVDCVESAVAGAIRRGSGPWCG